MILLVMAFFFPLLRGMTFSTVAGYQNEVYPWAATRNEMHFTPQSDQAELSYPWQSFIHNSLAKDDLPLWNPYSFLGEPFFSNGSSGLFYPPRLAVSLLGLSPSMAHDVLSVIDILGAGFFMFLFMRALRCPRVGALLATTVWMCGSFNLAWLHLEVSSPLTLFLPLDCLCVLRAVRSRRWTAYVLAWGVLGLTLASGHLPFLGIVFATAAAYGAALELGVLARSWRDRRARTTGLWRMGSFSVLPPLLAAVVLVPTLWSIQASVRGSYTYETVHESLRVAPWAFLHAFWPAWGPVTEKTMHEMAFVGTLVPLLALIGLLRRRPGRLFFGALAVIVPLLLLDTFLLRLVFAVFPWIGIVHNLGRLFFLWNFALAGLAGIGLENLFSWLRSRNRAGRLSPVWGGRLAWLPLAVVLVTAIQLVAYGYKLNPTFHPREDASLFPATPLVAALRGLDPNDRIVPLSPAASDGTWMKPLFNAATTMVWSIPSAGGYDSVIPGRTYRLLEVVRGRSLEEMLQTARGETIMAGFNPKRVRFDLLPRLGITYLAGVPQLVEKEYWPADGAAPLGLAPVYDGPDGMVWRVDGVPAGPRIASRAVVVDGPDAALAAMAGPEGQAAGSVILERSDVKDAPQQAEGENGADAAPQVAVRHRSNNALVMEATAPGPAFVVVPESWDAGWSATVNGRSTPVLHADYAFRAVPIPAGPSEIRLTYRPAGLVAGAVVTVLALAGAVWAARHLTRRS
jgi:hypothetical protein